MVFLVILIIILAILIIFLCLLKKKLNGGATSPPPPPGVRKCLDVAFSDVESEELEVEVFGALEVRGV